MLAVALLLVGSVIALLFIGRANAQPYILALLSALAVIGVFSLFAGAAGILRIAGRETRDTFLDALPATAPDGIVVTDQNGRRRLRQPRLSQAGRCGRRRRRAPGRARVRRRSAGLGGDLPARQGVARRAAPAGRGAGAGPEGGEARWLRFRVRPLAGGGPLRALDDLDRRRCDARP